MGVSQRVMRRRMRGTWLPRRRRPYKGHGPHKAPSPMDGALSTARHRQKGFALEPGARADLATTRPKRFELWPGSRALLSFKTFTIRSKTGGCISAWWGGCGHVMALHSMPAESPSSQEKYAQAERIERSRDAWREEAGTGRGASRTLTSPNNLATTLADQCQVCRSGGNALRYRDAAAHARRRPVHKVCYKPRPPAPPPLLACYCA
jgi:hypothetical protein